jgi:hypothetical protein
MALESIFEALESIFDVEFEFFGVFRLGLAGNEEFTEDGLVGNVGSWLDQPSPVSDVAGEVREEKKKKKKEKTRGRSVREG